MKNLNLLPLALLGILLYSCSGENKSAPKKSRTAFAITADFKGFEDSTWFFLDNAASKRMDSSMLIQGKLKFSGNLADSIKTQQVIVRTKDLSDYKFFWLEASDITLTGEKGKFRQSKITGSETEMQADLLNEALRPIDEKQDSVRKLFTDEISPLRREELIVISDSIANERKNGSIEFIKAHSTSIISAYLLSVYSTTWGKPLVQELYNVLSAENKQTDFGKNIQKYLTLNKDIKVGDHYADFEQQTPDGRNVKLSDVKGKLILLEFWAAWCGPCRQDNPELVKTYNTYKPKGFEILGVSLDNNADHWKEAIKKDGLPWENVSDLNGDKNAAALTYGIFAIPNNFLIDEEGVVIAQNLRGEDLKKKLKELLH